MIYTYIKKTTFVELLICFQTMKFVFVQIIVGTVFSHVFSSNNPIILINCEVLMNCCAGKVDFFFLTWVRKETLHNFWVLAWWENTWKYFTYVNHVGAITFKYTTEANLKSPSVHMERNYMLDIVNCSLNWELRIYLYSLSYRSCFLRANISPWSLSLHSLNRKR